MAGVLIPEALPLLGQVVARVDCRHRTHRHTRAAVDALHRIDEQLSRSAKPPSSFFGWMQSTGQASTHAGPSFRCTVPQLHKPSRNLPHLAAGCLNPSASLSSEIRSPHKQNRFSPVLRCSPPPRRKLRRSGNRLQLPPANISVKICVISPQNQSVRSQNLAAVQREFPPSK